MYFKASSLDDLLMRVYGRLLKSKISGNPTRGEVKEITGVMLRLSNPRARLSRTESRGKIFSSLGEWIWYMSGSNKLKFISYYIEKYGKESEDGRTLYGAYGPRIFCENGANQLKDAIALLKEREGTRRAVIQIFRAGDISCHHREIPCTCSFQFMVTGGKLSMVVYMRSNDAYIGLPHDIFAFTMLQEFMARAVGVELGDYVHMVGNLHLYVKNIQAARIYLNEGWQSHLSMPIMPLGDPWPEVRKLIRAESSIRLGKPLQPKLLEIDSYWRDIIRLLEVYRGIKDNDKSKVSTLRRNFVSPIYKNYISRRIVTAQPAPELHMEQTSLDL